MDEATLQKYVNRPYARILIREDDGGYGAMVLELPGCYSQGDDAADAMANLEEAMALWLEGRIEDGRPIPEPLMATDYSGNIVLRLPKGLHREAARHAQAEGTSLNQYLLSAVAMRVGMDNLAEKIADRLARRLGSFAADEKGEYRA